MERLKKGPWVHIAVWAGLLALLAMNIAARGLVPRWGVFVIPSVQAVLMLSYLMGAGDEKEASLPAAVATVITLIVLGLLVWSDIGYR